MTREEPTDRQRERRKQSAKRKFVITELLPELGIDFAPSHKPRTVEKARRKQLWKHLRAPS